MATNKDECSLFLNLGKKIKDKAGESEKWLLDKYSFSSIRTFEEIVASAPDGISLRELAQKREITAGTASVAVDILVKAGFVKRETSENDRRAIRLLPTKKALNRREKLDGVCEEFFEKALEGISARERKMFAKILEKMTANLEEI